MAQLCSPLKVMSRFCREYVAGVRLRLPRLGGALCVLLLGAAPGRAWAGGSEQRAGKPRDLTEISLEELMNIEVTSVSKKEQKLAQAPAAVYVITQEDIRRSGVTSIPEALRLAPGVQVARIDANKWAISARGFNGRWSNKLLVLIDGRRVYSPMFSGVYWDLQDTLLEDIERIEVIRGPGATMWGAGAVNGVVNVITRHARDTQGWLATAGGGSEERGFGGLRYGGRAGQAYYRGYWKYFQRNHGLTQAGEPAADGWDALRGGFRMDWEPSEKNAVTLQGDLYHGHAGQTISTVSLVPPFNRTINDQARSVGGSVLGRWKHVFSDRSEMALQVSFDRADRTEAVNVEEVDTYDVDFQHRLRLAARHELHWGVEGRYMSDNLPGRALRSFQPQSRAQPLFTTFLQDEVLLVEDRLSLTLGSKFEHNVYTGYEVQPGAQLLWTPNPKNTVWASMARAVRPPSRMNRDVRVDFLAVPGWGGMPILISAFGSPSFRSETLRSHELGWRLQASRRFSADVAAFYNVYHHLETGDLGTPYLEQVPAPPHLVLPMVLNNNLKGEAHGVELATNWNVTNRWKLSGTYSWLRVRVNPTGSAPALEDTRSTGESPAHQAHLRSYLDLPRKLSLDAALYYNGSLSAAEGVLARPGVPAYTRLDARLGWRPAQDLEVSVGLQNLLQARHPEFYSIEALVIPGNQVGRSIYGKVVWRF